MISVNEIEAPLPAKKHPTVDVLGTYVVAEPMTLQDPRSQGVYDIAPGEYPVMGTVSLDGKSIAAAGVIFAGTRVTEGFVDRISIVEKLRPIDVPALVQRQQLRLEQNADRSVKFPLSMFLGEAPEQTRDVNRGQSREQAIEHKRSR